MVKITRNLSSKFHPSFIPIYGYIVSGVGVQVSAIKKFQITTHKYQTNHNDRNSKTQTIDV